MLDFFERDSSTLAYLLLSAEERKRNRPEVEEQTQPNLDKLSIQLGKIDF